MEDLMDNNNHDVLKKFQNSFPGELLTVSDDFEERVFYKIRRKKTTRKQVAAVIVGFILAGSIFLAQSIIFHKNIVEDKQVFARQEYMQPESMQREEIPLTEDVIFTSSDSQNEYAIEQVVKNEGVDTI